MLFEDAFSFADTGELSQPLAVVQDHESDLFGYIDLQGNMVIPPKFKSASGFGQQGIAIITMEAGDTVINTKGEYLTRSIPVRRRPIRIHRDVNDFVSIRFTEEKYIGQDHKFFALLHSSDVLFPYAVADVRFSEGLAPVYERLSASFQL